QNGVGLAVQTESVVLFGRVPALELDHELDRLGHPDGGHTEEVLDVDDSDSPQLHVVTDHLGGAADERAVGIFANLDDVVRDEAVPSLNQVEGALALADAGVSEEQDSHAVHVYEHP